MNYFSLSLCMLLLNIFAYINAGTIPHENQYPRSNRIELNYQGGSCRERALCCPGRNRTCAITINDVNSGSTSGEILGNLITPTEHCYCDSVCITLGDCCPDYKDFCGVIDCQLSAWKDWSECDSTCGRGTMSRTRTILSHAQNGGKECLDLHQKRTCYGQQCNAADNEKILREIAILLPSSFSTTRQTDETHEIRRHLRFINSNESHREDIHEYVALYEVMNPTKKACEMSGAELSKKFQKGAKVCVQCQEAAMRSHLGYRCQGQGIIGKTTRWTVVGNIGCHGRWIRLDDRQAATYCGNREQNFTLSQTDFIFV